MACKAFIPYFFATLIRIYLIGSGGRIANWTISADASLDVFGMPWTNFPTRSMGRMNERCERLTTRTGNLPDVSSYVSL